MPPVVLLSFLGSSQVWEDWSGRFGVFNFVSRRAAGKFNTCKQTKIVRSGFLRNTRCDTLFVGSYRTHLTAIQPWIAVLSTWTVPYLQIIWNFYIHVFTPPRNNRNSVLVLYHQEKMCPGAMFKLFHAVKCTLNLVEIILRVVTAPRSSLVLR